MPVSLPNAVAELVEERLARLREVDDAGVLDADAAVARLSRLLLASDYAWDRLRSDPGALAVVLADAAPALEPPHAEGASFDATLRRHRHAALLALACRELDGRDSVPQHLGATSRLADACLEAALAEAERRLGERHGLLRDREGEVQRLVVFGLGKLGGSELNFSSDVDLVFGYEHAGESDGGKPLDAEHYAARLGQAFIRLLAEPGADGFVYRVDMRLRPFGQAGRLALGFDAMEQYFQREGRDWERYAWIKARPVAGDRAAGERFLATLRPFVYRRYLDYTAFEGLREMKGLIAAEVARRDLAAHLKLGPGGIREVEFIVQLLQLIRGGREPGLRQRGLLQALDALVELGYLQADAGARLRAAYLFLRRLENRIQLLREEQTHEPPDDPQARLRIALALGFDDWDALAATLATHREAVSAEFERVFDAPRRRPPQLAGFADYWAHLDDADAAERLDQAGMADADAVHAAVRDFARSPALPGLSARARGRLDRVLPALLAHAAKLERPAVAVERVLKLLHAVLRRSSYLALLAEQPAALERVVEVMAASAFLAERIGQHPLLLDDLLDRRSEAPPPGPAAVADDMAQALAGRAEADIEARLTALNEFRQSEAFRVALATVFARQPAVDSARQLALVAEAIVAELLPMARRELARSHGEVPGADADGSVAVIGYGSFGGRELGFGSDLDLVFLYDGALIGAASDGARPLDAPLYFARVLQRLVNLMGTLTPAGKLYDVDLRLRPDGAKGLLVSTIDSFAEYQRERAWTWEHQALVRARVVAGSPALADRWRAVRREVLIRARDADALARDVVAMRRRMRGELDRSRDGRFDLKQGEGGLVDLEFLLQALVLRHARAHEALVEATETVPQLEALALAGILDDDEAAALRGAHELLLARALACTLDARPRVVAADEAIAAAREAVRRSCAAHGLEFGAAD